MNCVLYYVSPDTKSIYSGDDPARLCNVEPIQVDPRCSPLYMYTGKNHCIRFCWYLQQPRYLFLWYVWASISYVDDILNTRTNLSPSIPAVSVTRVLNSSVCSALYNPPSPLWTYLIPALIFAVVLLVLGLVQTLKQSICMYKATKKWQPNRYMKLLVRDGIIYFLLYVTPLFSTVLGFSYIHLRGASRSPTFGSPCTLFTHIHP